MNNTRTSIILPCYNSESFIQKSIRSLAEFLVENRTCFEPWEVIAVDDGSVDHTAELIRESFPDVLLVRLGSNQGKGAAVRTGMSAARGKFRFFVDADMPFDLVRLKKMMIYLDQKGFDICIGARSLGQYRHYVQRNLLREIASFFFTLIVSRLVVTGIRDTQCGMKGFRADVADYLFTQSRVNGFAFDVEILYLAYKNDLDVKRIPVSLIRDDFSSVSVFRHSLRMVIDIAKLPFRYHMHGYTMMQPRPEKDEDY